MVALLLLGTQSEEVTRPRLLSASATEQDWAQNPRMLVCPPMPPLPAGSVSPSSGPPQSQDRDLGGGGGLFPLIMSFLPRRKVCTGFYRAWPPQGQQPSRVYMYILSASSVSLPLHRPGKEKGHAKVGLTPPHSAPPLPASQPPGHSVLAPYDAGASRQKAGVGFALFCSLDSISLLHCFPLAPFGVQDWGKGQIYAAIFIHSLLQVG